MRARIIREQITPHFKNGDFAAGVHAGVSALDKQIRGEALPTPAPPPLRSVGASETVWELFRAMRVDYLMIGPPC